MRTAREAFQLSGRAVEWKKVVATEACETACFYALAQLQSDMLPNRLPGQPIDPCAGLDANAQMQGAARVIEILKTIAEPITPPILPKRETLHY